MRALLLVLLIATSTATADPGFTMKDGKLVLPSPIVFEAGSARLKPDSEAALTHVKAYLDAKTDISLVRIESHTDTDGKASENQALSASRALVVAKALVGKGVDCHRLIPVGFGGTKPIAANDSPEHKAQNRRTDFVNAALRGHPIGGLPVDGGGQVAGDPCK